MAKIYIDTNVFLDFYQAGNDRLKVFAELVERADSIILTEQTLREFRRNRSKRLSAQAKMLEDRFIVANHTTSVVQELPQFSDWQKARETFNKNTKDMAKQLRDWINNDSSDLVLTKFHQLIEKATILPTTTSALEKAQMRKKIGEPPTSPDKHTIGDELIWETLIESCADDLIVVSRDNAFINYEAILKGEFGSSGKRKLLLVTKNLSEALKYIGKPSKDVDNAERILKTNPDWEGVCIKCGSEMETVGFEGSDDGGAWWLACVNCGNEEFPSRDV